MQNELPLSPEEQRRQRLARAGLSNAGYNAKYSTFIRWARLVLPTVAVMITAVVFTWSNSRNENLIPSADPSMVQATVGKNELLNPRFESTDEKKQPYTITAKRALQGETNEELVMLEEPVADMLLNSGNWIAIKAQQGAYRQDSKRLLLRGDVRLYHDLGYQMETAQLHIDLENDTAWSEDPVSGQGPAGTLKATGLKASTRDGTLLFTGPAELILTDTDAAGGMEVLAQ